MNAHTSSLPAHMLDSRSFREVREIIEADPAMAGPIRALLFPDDGKALPKWQQVVAPMPMTGLVAIESSISYNPSGRTTKIRKGREKLCWHVTLQAFTRRSKGLADPEWKGFCQLRTPERAILDGLRLTKPTQCRTPFSSQWADMIARIAEEAERQDEMLGFLHSKPNDGGTHYHEGQIMLVANPDRGAPDSARLVTMDGKGCRGLLLPQFVATSSSGKPLTSRYQYQSRATSSNDLYQDWCTGKLRPIS